jgi:hypothetical protein
MRVACCILTVWFLCTACGAAEEPQPSSPEQRAAAFLAAEVPKWRKEHDCYSCHNNGDAARVLAWCVKEGVLSDRAGLEDTLKFLAAPERWDANGPDGPFKDKKLARIQFAVALAWSHGAEVINDDDAMKRAAALVAELQSEDGSWSTDAPGAIGSPVTYGKALATAEATRVLMEAHDERYDEAIEKGYQWLIDNEPKSVLDAAATLLGLSPAGDVADARRKQCLELIARGQSGDGGWGPFVNSPSEVFDTALVVLALSTTTRKVLDERISRGRKYLLATQEADGGWPATTRPPGVDSYAQRISTSAWATMALLSTRPK